MKKFNADGGFRKDAKNEYDELDLNNYSGQSLEETTKALDDTILLSEEEIEKVKAEMNISDEDNMNMSR